jgi:large subunit ribosomal protein L35
MIRGKTAIRAATRQLRATRASSSSATSFEPAIPAGVNPAYDAALAYLSKHTSTILAQAESIRTSSPAEAERLEVQALINDPATRRAFKETGGKGQMDQAVMRYLAQQAWRKEGGLDLLMQRIHQMGVVPDVVPTVSSGRGTSNVQPMTLRVGGAVVEPGSILSTDNLSSTPEITVQLLRSTPETTYSLFIIDADAPSHETHSYAQRLVAWKTGIPLSVTDGHVNLLAADIGTVRVPYTQPAPEKGTGKHRYVVVVLPDPQEELPYPAEERSFDLRAYLAATGQSSADIAAITMFRSAWSSGVEGVEYGKPPMEARFGYPLSAQQKRQEAVREVAFAQAMEGLSAELGVDVEGKERV